MKKVLSFVLVLALVLGSFSMAFAAPTAGLSDVAGNANEEAINVVNGLGIVTGYPDGTFLPAQDVTRAEFAAMITRALDIPASALAGYTATSFNDVAGYTWAVPYLAFCETKGIMLGDGNGNVMPGRTINVNEAMTMVIRALGITDNSAWLVGSWPANYVTVAKKFALYDDVAATATVDRASAAQIIYNALTCNTYAVNADGDTNPVGSTLMVALGCTSTKAAVEFTADTKIDLNKYIGTYGTVYKNVDGDIVAVDVEGTVLEGKFNATGDAFKVGDITYTASTTDTFAYFLNNNKDNAAATVSAVTGDSVKVLAKVDGKVLTDIYTVSQWTATSVFLADEDTAADIAKDKKINGSNFLKDTSDNVVAEKFQVLGVDGLDKIAKGNVVTVYVGGSYVTKVEVSTKTIEGKVEKTSLVDGVTNYAIGGTNYEIATSNAGVTIALGSEGTFTLDYAGDIYKFEGKAAAAGNYAVVVATDAAASWGTTSYAIKLFTTEGTTITPVCDATEAAFAADAIVNYTLNDKGEIDTITLAATTAATGVVAANGKLINNKIVANDVVVLVNEGSDGWRLGKVAEFGDTVTATAITNSAAEIAFIFVDEANLAAVDTDDSYGLVVKKDEVVYGGTDGKTPVQVLNLLIDGAAKNELKANAQNVYTGSVTGAALLQKITIDENGVVTAVTNASVTSLAAATVTAVAGNIVTLDGTTSYQLADGVVVYAWDKDAKAWTVIDAAKLKDKTNVTLYDVKTDSKNPGYEIVIAR